MGVHSFKQRIIFSCLFIAITALPYRAFSQTTTAAISTDSLEAGEIFELSIKLQVNESYNRVIYPDSSIFPDVIDWISTQKFKITDFSDSVSYRLQFFANQNVSLPPFPVGIISNTDTTFIYTNPVSLHFKSVLPTEDAELKPMKPIFSFEGWPWALLVIIAAIIAAAVLAYFTFRKEDTEVVQTEIPHEPYKSPLSELEQTLEYLKNEYQLSETNDFKYFYSSLSDSIRTYFEDLYKIPALESTTRELLRFLDTFGVDHEMIKHTRQVLNKSDMVKFAKYTPTLDDAWICYEEVSDFVERARLVDASRISRSRTTYEAQFKSLETEQQDSEEVTNGMG